MDLFKLKKLRTAQLVHPPPREGFTLIELLTVVAVIAILAGLLLPSLARAKSRAHAIHCLNNVHQLSLAWLLYANDHGDRLTYNLGSPAAGTNLNNWVAGILDWELTPDNTNILLLVNSALGPYIGKASAVYHCPSDNVLSPIQRNSGWEYRVRSYSMNASVGDAGVFTTSGYNVNNPYYVQFFTLNTIPHPDNIFVFLDEHPDTLSDGYFLNKVGQNNTPGAYGAPPYPASPSLWQRLPASYHNGATSFSFADGHSEIHRWQYASTTPPAIPDLPLNALSIPADQSADFNWLVQRMSIDRW